jgi:hypothetical protein
MINALNRRKKMTIGASSHFLRTLIKNQNSLASDNLLIEESPFLKNSF